MVVLSLLTFVNKFKGVLFDFDGVLADTMEDHFSAWNHALGVYKVMIARDDFFPLEGMPVMAMASEICRITGADPAISQTILKNKDGHYLKNHQFRLYPGVEEIIDKLHREKTPLGIVSGGRRERITASVRADFLNKFKTLIAGEDTPRGKPFPDPYEEAARRIGCKAPECVVVENAPLGIRAAKAAGAYCIAIASTVSREKLQEADTVIDSFTDLKNILS